MLSPKLHIHVFNHAIHSFHFFGVLGFLMGNVLALYLGSVLHLDGKIILLMSVLGAATFFVLAVLAKLATGGETIVYYHHEIAILFVCSIALRLLQVPVLPYLDITIIGIATFLAFGRIGCFSVGCCHGKPAKNGVIYSYGHVKAGFTAYYEGVPLFPIQLAESLFVFCTIITAVFLLLTHTTPGTVLILYTVLYGAFRFVIEFFRGDPERPYWKGLSEAQWTTLFLIALSFALAFAGYFPLYIWHLIVTAALLAFSLFLVLQHNTKSEIFMPRHVRQIARVLNEPQDTTTNSKHNPASFVYIHKTGLGLHLSKTQLVGDAAVQTCYTVSFTGKAPLSYRIVEGLAVLIKQLQKHSEPFRIIEKQKNIFHISFSKLPSAVVANTG
jgi:prolipoprotein diacylglyceryltransferase